MKSNRIFFAAALLAASLTPLTAFADTAGRPPCILNNYRVTSVRPYEVEQHHLKFTWKQLEGADVFVQAQPGLTKEWLQLNLARHITQMHGTGMKDCAFDVKDVRVRVESAGTGFAVKLIAPTPGQAKEVLRRARLLVG